MIGIFLTGALLLAASGPETSAPPAGVYSSVVVDADSITFNVPIDVIGGTDALIAVWQEGIDAAWNYGNQGRPFEICGRRVRFNPQFAVRTSPASRPAHLVIVQQVKAGQPYLSSVWHALGTSPAYSPRTGLWGSNIDAETAAHEFGHLLGLLDEYGENDANNNGSREPGERPVPDTTRFPDASSSLMAVEDGVVLLRHLREIVRVHDAARTVGCSF